MIHRLQLRFIAIAMGCMVLSLCAVLSATNYVNLQNVYAGLDKTLLFLSENGGVAPGLSVGNQNREGMTSYSWNSSTEPTDGSGDLLELRYFIISSVQSPEARRYNLDFISSVTPEDAETYFEQVLAQGKEFGICDSFRYCIKWDEAGGYTAVFLYCREELAGLRSLRLTSLIVGVLSLSLIYILVMLLSKKAIQPFARSMERQKQFMTDASHELKTPLGILAANNDVLSMKYGDSEWTESSRGQIRRLSGLISDLVTLTRIDEQKTLSVPRNFNAGALISEVSEAFEVPSEQKSLIYEREIPQELYMYGDEAALRKTAEILLENAVKYTPTGGVIRVRLSHRIRYTELEVFNTVEKLPEANPLSQVFDRFFRGDPARSEEKGYGIGLSIAKTMMETIGGRLSVHSDDEHSIRFTAEL